MLNWLNCWELLLYQLRIYWHVNDRQLFFSNEEEILAKWASRDNHENINALLQEVENTMVSSSWLRTEYVYGLSISKIRQDITIFLNWRVTYGNPSLSHLKCPYMVNMKYFRLSRLSVWCLKLMSVYDHLSAVHKKNPKCWTSRYSSLHTIITNRYPFYLSANICRRTYAKCLFIRYKGKYLRDAPWFFSVNKLHFCHPPEPGPRHSHSYGPTNIYL